ncbi:YbhB/YbcL family Raf kinase inhibitor-like protein [Leifsonia sp. ZF2019]|uniref:YbhB/YbcL family Raf kinase inhibitor-like protein n=1 Tax=Leifsonia sp. ZF2019 TaxID=2781978 RepID=UPI001CBECE34|nr:YbhB/YbcL family Raf kinase inhibitor-like protein [Leifsonia sp. ZF2019]UAJ79686.1 YbhB/YbcL family Raf kinase inhibitor-like protein [Leifsonia sp. ZF2019]
MTSIDPFERFGAVPQFTLESDDVADGRPLSRAQWGSGGGGDNVSPQLSWSGFPAETKSFAVTIHDPDAPTGSGFWHWAVFNIPAEVTTLAAGAGAEGGGSLPQGAAMLSNELRSKSFTGAGPPPGTGTHHYDIVVHALDVERLDLDPESTPAVLGFNAHFHTLARAVLTPVATAGDI